MKVSVLQDKFLAALKRIKPYVDPKPLLPILACVLIEARDDAAVIYLSGTNLQRGLQLRVGARVDVFGDGVAVNHALLLKTIERFPAQRIDISVVGDKVVFQCGSKTATLPFLPQSEYPSLQKFRTQFEMSVQDLSQDIARIAYAQKRRFKRTAERPVLEGVKFEIKSGNYYHLKAADGYRLALAVNKLVALHGADTPEFIMDIEDVDAFQRFLADEKGAVVVKGGIDDDFKRVMFEGLRGTFWSFLVEGRFPDSFEGVIPRFYETELRFPREALLEAIKSTKIYNESAVSFSLLGIKGVAVWAKSLSREGEYAETFEVDNLQYNTPFAYDPNHLIDILKTIKDDTVMFQLQAAPESSPLRIDDGNVVHVVMPVQNKR